MTDTDSPSDMQAWLLRLEQLHPKNIELGLQRAGEVLQRLQLPAIASKIVMLAGTNGKGSCARLIESGLLKAGKTTACYTSPHLIRFNERLRINEAELSDAKWLLAFQQVEQARQSTALTFFEFTTLAAFCLIADEQVDVAILEIGLGGRLDAVNLMDADIAVVTSIGLDHQDWLGDTIEKIAEEKLGIVKANSIFICGADTISQRQLAAKPCRQQLLVGKDFFVTHQVKSPEASDAFSVSVAGQSYSFAVSKLLPRNIAIATQVLSCLLQTSNLQPLVDHLSHCELTGRFQAFVKEDAIVVFDVAHNADAAQVLAEKLHKFKSTENRLIAVIGMLADKSIEDVVVKLLPMVDAWMVCELPGVTRAAQGRQLIDVLHQQGEQMVSLSKNPKQAFARASQLAHKGDVILVTGSFHTVGAILPKFCDAIV